MNDPALPPNCQAIIAIPACNEADRIGDCLAALAVQRHGSGAPIEPGSFAVLVFANNCRDATARRARELVSLCPFPLIVIEQDLPEGRRSAGWARKIAMDRAADLLACAPVLQPYLFTTDADSRVGSTWVANTFAAFAEGADAVAGYIEADPAEYIGLGPTLSRRGSLEDTYLALMAEILARCDPLAHDPWPNHRVASGASLAVSLSAYRAVGGLPPKPLGEDVAFAVALVQAGFKLRHALDVVVVTSCRLEGRAQGGAADTMRLRRDEPETACDADMEPAIAVFRRAAWKRRLRSWFTAEACRSPHWAGRLRVEPRAILSLAHHAAVFEAFWVQAEAESPVLRRLPPLRPKQLPGEIAAARRIVGLLRRRAKTAPDVLAPAKPHR